MRLQHFMLTSLVMALAAGARGTAIAQHPPGWKTDFTRHIVPLDEIVSGGPPKDGIPSIDEPRFTDVTSANAWIEGTEPVMVIEHGGTVRVYPIQILIWHEIVNDRIGDVPVAVTFCPLCNTALAFDRRFDGHVLDFGATGRLRHSDLVMYDRQTETWWQQATGEGLVGTYAGGSLTFVPARMFSWDETKRLFPGASVLSRQTGHDRPYGRNPYAGYDRSEAPIRSFFAGSPDSRLRAMERVAAVRIGTASVAYPFDVLRRVRVVNDTVSNTPVVAFWTPGTSSALDAATIGDGRDVGSTAVFRRRVRDRVLRFEPAPGNRFRDVDTGSLWTMDGRAVEGPLAGARLDAIVHGDYFWFAWAVFRPDTRIWSR